MTLENTSQPLVPVAEKLEKENQKPVHLLLRVRQCLPDGLKHMPLKIVERSMIKPSGCIEWMRGKDWDGYGIVHDGLKSWRSNRLSFYLFVGEIPDGKQVCHSCDNPACINPDHLWIGSSKENVQDCKTKGRFTGPKGELNGHHVLSSDQVLQIANRYRRYDKNGNNLYDLAREFGVHPVTIHDIISGRKWRSVTNFSRNQNDNQTLP